MAAETETEPIDSLAQLVNQSTALQVRFDIIQGVAAKIGRSIHSEWVESLAKEALSSYRAAAVADVPKLVEVAKDRGVGILEARYVCGPVRAAFRDIHGLPSPPASSPTSRKPEPTTF